MYDVLRKQTELRDHIRRLIGQIKKNDIDGLCILSFKKDKTIERYQFDGEVSVIEWVGALEAIKTYYLATLIDDIEEDL